MQTLRFGDPDTVTQYPLPIPGSAPWQRSAASTWTVDVPLPRLEAGTILAPSLSLLSGRDYAFRFVLHTPGKAYPLPPVPSTRANRRDPDPSDATVRTAIDCFHIASHLADSHLQVRVHTRRAPARYLLAVSIRPTELDVQPPDPLPPARAPRPPTISQMLCNPRVARSICSPVSTAMVLRGHGARADEAELAAACYDPASGMFGLWPLAVRAASRHGLIGAVELLSDFAPVEACLNAGLPLVASIRFAAGGLPGAPLASTGGHLVVVWGLDGGEVLVNDPAAPHHGSVSRRYPAEAFARAWFRHRGAAYILTP